MPADVIWGTDFKAKQREERLWDDAWAKAELVDLGIADTAPCETNPTPFVAPEWDGA